MQISPINTESIRDSNKEHLKCLTAGFDKNFHYAERVVRRLTKKGTVVTRQMVYQAVGGSTYSPEITWTIIVLARAKRIADIRLNKHLKRIAN